MAQTAQRDRLALGELGAKSAGHEPPQIKIDLADAGPAVKAAIASVRMTARLLVAEAKSAGAVLAAAQELIEPEDWLAWCREHGLRQKAVRRFIAVHRSAIHETVIARDGLAAALVYLASPEAAENADD